MKTPKVEKTVTTEARVTLTLEQLAHAIRTAYPELQLEGRGGIDVGLEHDRDENVTGIEVAWTYRK